MKAVSLFRRATRRQWILSLPMVAVALSGCKVGGYYAQAIHGEYEILSHRKSIDKLIADSRTPPELREELQLVQRLRTFARTDLKLPVDGNYDHYVDVHRKYVVWDVQAAPEFSIAPKTWHYPFVGTLAYRGYFSEKEARAYGDRLRREGFDVYVDGVEAYSTLGWFKDPILSTFISMSESELAELLFHELGHKRVFASGDTDFDEAYASEVGQEGARRWLRMKGDSKLLEDYEAQLARDSQFVHLIMATRERLQKVYGSSLNNVSGPKSKLSTAQIAQLRREKQEIFDDLRHQYADLKAGWGGYAGYDNWFSRDLNNAKLNTVANYYDYLPGFHRLLQENGGDLDKFYAAVERLAKEPMDQRHQKLRELAQAH
jgi:predicted aminopeptidase